MQCYVDIFMTFCSFAVGLHQETQYHRPITSELNIQVLNCFKKREVIIQHQLAMH